MTLFICILILLYVFAEYIVLHKSSLEVFSLVCEKCGLVNGYDVVEHYAKWFVSVLMCEVIMAMSGHTPTR